MYWAWVTMGTHGYGDIVPIYFVTRCFASVWIIVGLIFSAILTGALTASFTANNVNAKIMMYGLEIAAVQETKEHTIAVLRNAKASTEYKNIDAVGQALVQRKVKGALVDVFSAGARSDLFKKPQIVAMEKIEYPAAYGIVLSGGLQHVSSEIKDYLSVHSNDIIQLINESTDALKVNIADGSAVSLFDPKSTILKLWLSVLGSILFVVWLSCALRETYKKRRERARIHYDGRAKQQTAAIEELCEQTLTDMEKDIAANMDKLFQKQLGDRLKMMREEGLRKKDGLKKNVCKQLPDIAMKQGWCRRTKRESNVFEEDDVDHLNVVASNQNWEGCSSTCETRSSDSPPVSGQVQVAAQLHGNQHQLTSQHALFDPNPEVLDE